MNEILDKWGYDYQGTDMWKDAKRLRKEQVLELEQN